MQTAKLKNGREEAVPLINVTMVSLQSLMEASPIAFYELVEVCKDKDHKPFGNADVILKNLALMEPGGGIHGSIRNIILSAIDCEGLEMHLVNPVEVMVDEEEM